MQMQIQSNATQQQQQQAIQNQLMQNQQNQSQSIVLQGQPVVLQSPNGQQITVSSGNINIQHPGVQQMQVQQTQNMHSAAQVNIQPKPMNHTQLQVASSMAQSSENKMTLPIVSSTSNLNTMITSIHTVSDIVNLYPSNTSKTILLSQSSNNQVEVLYKTL